MVEPIFERVFVKDELDEVNYYYMCNNHRMSDKVKAAPSHRLDFRMKVWDVFDKLPDEDRDKAMKQNDWSLEERLWDEIHESLNSYEDSGETPFSVFTDMNGYRLLCDIPVYELFEKREEYEQELADVYDRVASQGFKDGEDEEEIQDLLEQIRETDEELCRVGLQLKRFNEIAKSYEDWDLTEGYIWIKKVTGGDEDEDDEYKLVGDWELDDYIYDDCYGDWIIIDTKYKDIHSAQCLKNFFELQNKTEAKKDVEIQTIQC